MQGDSAGIKCMFDFGNTGKQHALTRLIILHQGDIIQTQYNILRRHNNRRAVSRMQNVVGRHHQHACFQLCFQRQRHMNRHLITIKVSIKGRTHQRMKLNGFTFNQHRLKRLNAQSVQCWCPVEQNRMFANNFIENIPDFRLFAFNQLFGLLHCRRQAFGLQS